MDQSGTFVGSSFSHATARDWARFGQLFLNKGEWNGEQVLPEAWVDFSLQPVPSSHVSPNPKKPHAVYGAQWWLNKEFKLTFVRLLGGRRGPAMSPQSCSHQVVSSLISFCCFVGTPAPMPPPRPVGSLRCLMMCFSPTVSSSKACSLSLAKIWSLFGLV
mgnify:CR=1 FL=1